MFGSAGQGHGDVVAGSKVHCLDRVEGDVGEDHQILAGTVPAVH